jgi:hypothetical protein
MPENRRWDSGAVRKGGGRDLEVSDGQSGTVC